MYVQKTEQTRGRDPADTPGVAAATAETRCPYGSHPEDMQSGHRAGAGQTHRRNTQKISTRTDTLQGTCPAEEADAFPWEEELGSVRTDDKTTELDGWMESKL